MDETKQRDIDELAKKLRNTAALYSDLFKISHGLEQDPELVRSYLEGDWDYENLKPRIENLLEEAEEVLPDTKKNRSNREEQIYRFFRKEGEIDAESGGNWRDYHSEPELIDNHRDDEEIDYGPLIRARATVLTFAMEAAKFDEDHYEWLPDIEGDDTEIVEETADRKDSEVQPTAVAANKYGKGEESAAYGFWGWIDPE